MIVIDASLAIEILLHSPLGERHAHIALDEELHAPQLIDIEFAHVLRRLVRNGLDLAAAQSALNFMREWRIERHGHTPYLDRIWALRDSISAYDAAYISVAEGIGAPLLTCDARLGRAHGHNARVVVLN